VNLAKNQRTLPELINGYRKFLEHLSQKYVIIIGIDELDKLESDEKAQRFLNEIKALFGLERCFYLLSVSENALSNFERRGLPFRDVFDSSFDDIVRIDYLDLEKARNLLRRRVIGVPIPFLDFCYCMAGGLPRDLIRALRNLFEERGQANSSTSSLSKLCGSLIRSELKSKVSAMRMEAKEALVEPEATQLFEQLRELESLLESTDYSAKIGPRLLESSAQLVASENQALDQKGESTKIAGNRERIASLSAEMGVYLYYSLTLLEFFSQEQIDEETWKSDEILDGLAQLARARQFFAISRSIAKSAITDFRRSHGMDTLQDAPASSRDAGTPHQLSTEDARTV